MLTGERIIQIKRAADKVADLWIEQMQKSFNKDNGDSNSMLFLLTTMATQRAQTSLNPGTVAQFKMHLMQAITDHFDKNESDTYWLASTDYHPDDTLGDAAIASGINPDAFPWKSCTQIYLDKAEIHYYFGYGKPWQTINF